ncbi:DUF4328 domain-containing protein [Alteromonas gracilis]|uniref:DUF4328 domain-containing protein n=1 Tax=Alteromonas gracilis TaxID=1479524 RepID=UPI0037365D63
MSNKNIEFKEPIHLVTWIKYLLYAQVLIAVIAIGSNLLEYQLLSDFQDGVYFSQEMAVADAEANDKRQQIIALMYLGIFIVSGYFILKWIYQSNQNARQLGAKDMAFTPAWSIGFYVIPIVCLWKPYQAMKEIWKASHNPTNWQMESASPILGLWWFFWIANNILGQVVYRMLDRAEEISQIMNVNIVSQVSELLSIPLAIVTWLLISKISSAQMASRNFALSQTEENSDVETAAATVK